MFLLHPRVAKRLNTSSLYTPFAPDGLSGPSGEILRAQQANRLLAFGKQSLASSGGAASLCGGAAGPGGGPAGALGGAGTGAAAVAAGGSNGAAGGACSGNQEIGRFVKVGSTIKSGPIVLDDVAEIDPLLAGGGSLLLRSGGGAGSNGLAPGPGSTNGQGNNEMSSAGLTNFKNKTTPPPLGPPTCPNPPTSSKK